MFIRRNEAEYLLLSAKDLAKPKQTDGLSSLLAQTGPYDYRLQRRWKGRDVALIRWTMKSSTSFDGEDPKNEADPEIDN